MSNLKFIITSNKLFFISFLLLTAFASFVCIYFSKADGFYFLNPYHTKWLDYFFTYFTFLGDGITCVVIGLIFFFFKRKLISLLVLSSYVLSGIIAQTLKYFIVEARPAVFLKDTTYNYFINDVTLHNYHSFPSGHSTSIFAVATVLALSYKNKWVRLLLLIIAAGVGYSRIYLGQHFCIDVLSGALIGVVSGIICRMIWYKKLSA